MIHGVGIVCPMGLMTRVVHDLGIDLLHVLGLNHLPYRHLILLRLRNNVTAHIDLRVACVGAADVGVLELHSLLWFGVQSAGPFFGSAGGKYPVGFMLVWVRDVEQLVGFGAEVLVVGALALVIYYVFWAFAVVVWLLVYLVAVL